MQEPIWYYIVVYIGNLITYFLAAFTEMHLLKRRPDFPMRVLLCSFVAVLVTAAEVTVTMLLPNEGARGYVFSVTAHSAVLLIWAFVAVCYEANIRKSLFIACGAIIVRTLTICECSILLFAVEQIAGVTFDLPIIMATVGFLFSAIMLGVWLLLPAKKRVSTNIDELMITSPVTLVALCFVLPVLYSQVYFVRELHPGLHFLILLAETALCLVGLGIQYIITTQYRAAMDRELSDRLIKESEKRFMDVKENMEIINIKCHDLRHRLRDYEEAHGALTPEMRELTRSINIYDSRLHTGNETLDIVLSDHMLRAVNRSVQLSVVADGQLVAFMERADLYALFDNLLGNALEYLETQPEENRFVRLSVRGMSGFVRIEAENWFSGTLTMDGGLPVSTKGDETEHGFGMKSIRRIVEKYNGTMSVGAESDLFTVRIILKQP